MIQSYGFSIVGTSHEAKGTDCQDANIVRSVQHNGQIVIAAVADGVGSSKHSDIASKIAVEVSSAFCESKLKEKAGAAVLTDIIEEAFLEAELAIEKRSLSDGKPLPDYDTTLDLAIYDGKWVHYGHCGDGGIVGLTYKGDYVKITTPQKNDGIYVVPLRNGSKYANNTWDFGTVEEEFAGILLATDGIYDIFFPYLLRGQPVDVYVPLIRYFMDNNVLTASAKNIEAISKEREGFFSGDESASITDDKTLLVLINDEAMPELKDDAFYDEPDWELLQEQWNKKAYPHLYKSDTEQPDDTSSAKEDV